MLDHDGDLDYFVFEAVQEMAYRISTELGSLRDSVLELLKAGGLLALRDDCGNRLASRIDWLAPKTGTYWLAVGG